MNMLRVAALLRASAARGADGFTKGWIGAQPPEWLKKVAKLRSTDRPCRIQQRSRIPPANQYLLRIPSHHRRFTKLLPSAGRSLYAPPSPPCNRILHRNPLTQNPLSGKAPGHVSFQP